MARFVFALFGDPDEARAFMGLASLLRERGHVVKFLGPSRFAEAAEAASFDFTSVGSEENPPELARDAAFDDRETAARSMLQSGTRTLRRFYEAICLALMVEPAVLVAPIHHLAARAVKDKYRVPLVGIHLQPDGSDKLTGARIGGEDWQLEPLPGMDWQKSTLTTCLTTAIAPAVRKFCDEIGINPPRHGLRTWTHPPDLNLMLFPRWFSRCQPDPSSRCVFAGFPPEVPCEGGVMPADLREFLETGKRPVILSLENRGDSSQAFFETGLRACALLGLRALVVTRHQERLPQPLPSGCFAVSQCSYGDILSRAHAVIHDGGIHIVAQCLAAGVPQLVVPTLCGPQSNAALLRWLGAGESLMPALFSVDIVASALLRLTSSNAVKTACEAIKQLCLEKSASSMALTALEKLACPRRIGSDASTEFKVIEPGPGFLVR